MEIATDVYEARKDDRVEIADQNNAAINVRQGWESIYSLEFGIISHGENAADDAETRKTNRSQVRQITESKRADEIIGVRTLVTGADFDQIVRLDV